jgi:hypothetical protein
MEILNDILTKLQLNPIVPPKAQPPAGQTPAAQPANRRDIGIPATTPAQPAPASGPKAEIPMVDVYGKLEKMAAARPEKLDWKVSIADLLNLLGMDYSYNFRKQLATELGCPADKMVDSYQMNIWLHKTVLQKIAQSGGNIPKDLIS